MADQHRPAPSGQGKKWGRPPGPSELVRKKKVFVWLNDDEDEIVTERAEASGMTKAAYAREILLKGKVVSPPNIFDAEASKNLSVISGDLKRLATMTVKGKTPSDTESQAAAQSLLDLRTLVDHVAPLLLGRKK